MSRLKNASLMLGLMLWSGCFVAAGAQAFPAHVTDVQTQPDGPFLVNGAPTFPIGITGGPPTGAATPWGQNAMAYLASEGHVFQLWYCPRHKWGPEKEAELDALVKEADKEGLHIVISIDDFQHIKSGDTTHIAELKRVVEKYRDHPSIFFWKGADEPQWGKIHRRI